MLNLKKGLALVLAAATAFTFAPVANLGASVQAEAANGDPQYTSAPLTLTVKHSAGTGQTATFDLTRPDQVPDTGSVKIVSSDHTKATLTVGASEKTTADNTAVDTSWSSIKTNGIKVTAVGVGEADLGLEYTDNLGNTTTITKHVTVTWANHTPASVDTKITTGTPADGKVAENGSITVRKGANSTAAIALDNPACGTNLEPLVTADITTSNPSVVSVTGGKLKAEDVGTSVISVPYTFASSASEQDKNGTFTFTVTVIPAASTLKIDGETITSTVTVTNPASVIYLTPDAPTQTINAVLSDPLPNEKLKFTAYDSDGTTKTNAISVDKNGVVTGAAKAFEAPNSVYTVKVEIENDTTKSAFVKVVTDRQGKNFSAISASIEGKDYTAKAGYKADTTSGNPTYTDANTDVDVKLSTADKQTLSFAVNANSTNGFEVKSGDPNTVAADVAGNTVTLTAKRLGTVNVTVSNKTDSTHYGTAKLTLKVSVTTQLLNVSVEADPSTINLSKATKTAKINASVVATPALTAQPTLKYQFVTLNDKGEYIKANSSDLDLSDNGTLTYKTTKEGQAIVEISADATSTYAKPKSAYVTVNYTQKKSASQLTVDKNALNLAAGETESVAASGTAISVKSSDEDVATASYADGQVSVTGVKKGVAVITVTDAGNDNIEAGSAQIVVYVDGATVTPEKVTGLKVSNKKGANVSVSWTSQGKNINYRVYKKVNGGKWIAKNVAGNKTSLMVKKGAKVQVKVKAYVKDENGKTTWGPTATKSKTFKTDKK